MDKYFYVIDRRGEVLTRVAYKDFFLFKEYLKGKLEAFYDQLDVAVIGWFTDQQADQQRSIVREVYEVHFYLLEMDFSYHPQGHYTHPDTPGEFTEYDALKLAEEMNGRHVPKYSSWRTSYRRNPLGLTARKRRKKWD